MKEQSIDLGPRRGNLRLNVAFAGRESGNPLVLLHGFPESWWSWRHQIDALTAAGFRVMQSTVPDLRIVRFPRCGHFPHSETPPAVNDALLAFLAEH